MSLHILTISSRFHLLPKIWESIKDNEDIVWHIGKSVFRQDKIEQFGDDRVKIYEISCEDNDTGFKMNYLFNKIKDLGGYFCILDDDTTFNFSMYGIYEMYIGSKIGMIIGSQQDKEGRIRLRGSYPRECCIDSGNVLCHLGILDKLQWGYKHWDDKYHADFDFWDKVFKVYGLKGTDIKQRVISNYNFLSDIKDSLDYVRE